MSKSITAGNNSWLKWKDAHFDNSKISNVPLDIEETEEGSRKYRVVDNEHNRKYYPEWIKRNEEDSDNNG